MNPRKTLLGIAFWGCSYAFSAHADVAGMVCHLAGHAQLRSGAAAWKPLQLLQRLEAGEEIRCGPADDAVVVLFTNGARYNIGAGHQATVNSATVVGGSALAGVPGPSAAVLRELGGARVGATMARGPVIIPPTGPDRLSPGAPLWLPETQRQFSWAPVPGAVNYTFSFADKLNNSDPANALWSHSGTTANVSYPADQSAPQTRYPYVWRVESHGQDDQPLSVHWGIITFLSQKDSAQLAADVKTLKQMAAAAPNDPIPVLLLSQLYRQYGVMQGALETLSDKRLKGVQGIADARRAIYAELCQ